MISLSYNNWRSVRRVFGISFLLLLILVLGARTIAHAGDQAPGSN